jgi:LPXTG-motif cell wall-anchored protein
MLDTMFDFQHPQQRALTLAANGTVAQIRPVVVPVPAAASPSAPAQTQADPSLAATGVSAAATVLPVIGAVLLLAAGITLVLFRRRRAQ